VAEYAGRGCTGPLNWYRNLEHWTQQERPDEVSEAMIGFIRELD
jgi:hypothetical protein